MIMETWVERHRRLFNSKSAIRFYYLEVFAKLIRENLLPGPTLEIGSGPGFLSHLVEDLVTSDVQEAPGVQVVCDAQALHFPDGQFSNVFFVDVMHHLQSPLASFREISRVLLPGGRLIMIEPYTSPISKIFYKFVHRESCCRPVDAWNKAMPFNKEPMEGNAEIPRVCLLEQNGPVSGCSPVSGLRLSKLRPFAGLSYLLTGGFQAWQFPLPFIRGLYYLEEKTLPFWASLAATRCLAVLEKP